jgi:hypothetical protein
MPIEFTGKPILVEFRPHLRAWRGKLLCGGERGAEVHAGSFLRERRIVLDRALLRNAKERDRILAHEIFHFVWWKLQPVVRAGYREVLRAELRKERLGAEDWHRNTRRSKEYFCESFCDTAAAFMLDRADHEEITLPARARGLRRAWMEESLVNWRLNI